MRRALNVALLAAALALLGASPARAGTCEAALGTAAVDQYCVLLPGAGGDESPFAVDPSTPRLRNVLSPAQVRRLERAGPVGRMLLALPVLSRNPAQRGRANLSPSLLQDIRDILDQGDLSQGDVAGQVSGALRSDASSLSSFSPAFRWALLISLVGLVGTAWQRGRVPRPHRPH